MRPQFRFDDLVLDLEAFRLTRSGLPIHLEPKVLELLGYLVQHRGRLVEKPELQAALWSDTAVSESALTRAVAQLRKALDDDAREARYVETVPTRGYRFRSEVTVEQGPNGRPLGNAAAAGPASKGEDPPQRAAGPARRWLAVVGGLGLVGLLAAFVATSQGKPPAAASAVREVQRSLVSTSRGFNAFPTFSPDGGTLAFSSDRSGRLEIYVRALAPGATEMPVTSDGQDNVQPAWSPDGRQLAYHSMRRGGVWLVPAHGGAPRQISEFGSAPAWSPDGRRVAFSSLGLAALDGMPQYSAALWVIDLLDLPSAEPRPLTGMGNPATGHGPPVFSADGHEVFFVAEGIWAVNGDGSRQVRRVADGSAMDIAVSPDGQTLYSTSWERGNWRIWSASLPLLPGPAGERIEMLNTGDLAARHLVISPQGRLACALVSLTSELALVPLAADGSPAGPATEPWPGATGRKTQLRFSPDGRTLGFARAQPGQGVEIWGLDVRTGAARTLLPSAETSFLNGWFPQGDALLVTSRGDSTKTLLRAPLTGSRPDVLQSAEGVAHARLLSSGREIVFHAVTGGILNVHRSNLDGSAARALTDDRQGVGWPVPSPDGSTLAVEMFRGNDTQLGLMPSDGGVPRPITNMPGQHWSHDWSPDGRRVLYAARRDGLWNVYWIDVLSGEERRLTDLGRVREAVRSPVWSSAGDRIAYERTEAAAAVWVLDLTPTAAP